MPDKTQTEIRLLYFSYFCLHMAEKNMNKESQTLSVLYKNLFSRLKDLILNPGRAWSSILPEQVQINDVLAQFSLPLIGAYTAATFVGYLFFHQGLSFDLALRDALFAFSSCFFGLYLAWFVLIKLLPAIQLNESKENIFKLVAYPSLVIYLVGIVNNLVPQTYFFGFLHLYAGYIIWEGLGLLIPDNKDSRILLTIVITIAILVLPFVIGKILFRISPI